ncbi:MAG TPA: multiheme c-type cytochrome [Pirellulales bacterium]|nr:multiheme c-type cytochrome [Pirellulales bacterium]
MPPAARFLAWCLLALVLAVTWQLSRTTVRERAEAAEVLRGVVLAAGRPVSGASVRIVGRPTAAVTDRRGRFTLPLAEADRAANARVAASLDGFFIAGADAHSQPIAINLTRLPPRDETAYDWVDPRPSAGDEHRCGNCHAEIYDEWSASAHARSATNRRFLNVYDGSDWHGRPDQGWNLLSEFPEGAGVCYSCHFPSAQPSIEVTADLRRVADVDRQGVHCDFCHKVSATTVEHVGLNHGRFAMSLLRPAGEGQVFFGPLDDVDRGEDAYRALYRDSRYCASCHEGTMFGVRAYETYSEWRASPQAKAGVQCQDCHMASTGRMTNFAPGHGGREREAATLASHRLPGADPDFLREHLGLSVQARRGAAGLEVETEVRVNGVGHRTPTGHPTRALLLHVEAVTDDGQRLAMMEGPVLPALCGEGPSDVPGLSGQPGKLFAKVLRGVDGELGAPFWRASGVAYDTRLNADQVDRTAFIFTTHPGTIRVAARLIYRHFSKPQADAKHWPDNEIVVVSRHVQLGITSPQ